MGTVVLGCVSHINELELVVSLPNQIVGTIAITEVSDPITSMVEKVAREDEDELMEGEEAAELPDLNKYFHVGQWVHCKVIAIQEPESKRPRVDLSIKPSTVNQDLALVDINPGLVIIKKYDKDSHSIVSL